MSTIAQTLRYNVDIVQLNTQSYCQMIAPSEFRSLSMHRDPDMAISTARVSEVDQWMAGRCVLMMTCFLSSPTSIIF